MALGLVQDCTVPFESTGWYVPTFVSSRFRWFSPCLSARTVQNRPPLPCGSASWGLDLPFEPRSAMCSRFFPTAPPTERPSDPRPPRCRQDKTACCLPRLACGSLDGRSLPRTLAQCGKAVWSSRSTTASPSSGAMLAEVLTDSSVSDCFFEAGLLHNWTKSVSGWKPTR